MIVNAFSLGMLDMRFVYELLLYWALSSPLSLSFQVILMMSFSLSGMMRWAIVTPGIPKRAQV